MDPLVCLNMDHTSKIGMYVGNMFMFTMGLNTLNSQMGSVQNPM